MRDVILYSALRVLLFAVPFAVLLWIGFDWWWAALIAAIAGLCLSYVLLQRQRDRVTQRLAAARAGRGRPDSDEAAEDRPSAGA